MTKFRGEDIASVKPFELQVDLKSGGWVPDGSRPAFLIKLQNGSKCVLKGEILSATDVASRKIGLKSAVFIGGMHSHLTSDLNVVPVSDDEMLELCNLRADEIDFSGPADAAVTYIRDLVGSNMFVFYTMAFVEGLKNLESQVDKGKDKTDLAKVGACKLARKMCTDSRLLPELGKVIAVDLFSGNTDRFSKEGKIVNSGNILFRKNLDKTYSPVGVDFFEAQGDSKMYAPLLDPQSWGGRILADKQEIDRFASRAVMSLNNAFAAAIQPVPMPLDAILGGAQVVALANGISSGADELRRYLLNLRKQARGVPAGVASRMDVLGWTNTGWVSATKPPPIVTPAPLRPATPTPTVPPVASTSGSNSPRGRFAGIKFPKF